jgi:hypothetical protein
MRRRFWVSAQADMVAERPETRLHSPVHPARLALTWISGDWRSVW